ncbi:MAG: hypothetical protein WKF87_03095 [Chryseolinea sp.]
MALLLLLALPLMAQQKQASSIPASFPDSVKTVLGKTRNADATLVGTEFFAAWNAFTSDQQSIIQRQVQAMRKKKLPLRPYLSNYFGALASAISVERADAGKLRSFLSVTDKVLENEKLPVIGSFFQISRTFFQHHALHFEKPFRLYARDDEYTFDYILPTATFDLNDPSASTDQNNPSPSITDNSDQQIDTAYVEAPPLWMNAPPQPLAEGPVIRFNKISLTLVTNYDSVSLKNTKGVVSMRSNLFIGEQGSFEWTPAGLGPDVVTCNLDAYSFDIRKPEVKSDLVKLNYAGKTPGYIPGVFEFRSVAHRDSVPSSYPRFRSFQNNLKIQGIADENVKYTGAFSLTGNKIGSTSVTGEPSTLEIYHNNVRKLTARSAEFLFTDSTIQSQRSSINIPIENDSITHPTVRMKYTYGKDSLQKILLQKDKGAMKHTPYSASFFNIDFTADVIRWDLFSDSLNMLTEGGRNTVPLILESIDFYDPDDFRLLGGKGFSFHPLGLVANYCIKNNIRDFYTGDLAQFSKKSPQDLKAAMEFLSEKGLVTYFPKTDFVHVKEKAILIYKSDRGDADYDNLKIHSVIDSFPNVTLNFDKRYMIVRGVEEFKISDSLNVRITPDSSVITILQNRDIKFDGTITAGNFEISGKGFTLKYDSFFIKLTHIDSVNLYVTETNARGQTMRRKVNNSMVPSDSTTTSAGGGLGSPGKSSGTLFISKANNKSGKKQTAQFPRLDAASGGAIYFDREEVLGGVYDRSIFFAIPPFELDSLNNTDKSSINFGGTFNSSGMFPVFKEKLHTQPDKSLGFDHVIPQNGYKLYNGSAKMTGELTMNSRGLRGNGTIENLAATVNAQDFVFYPDSVMAKGTDATITSGKFGSIGFPDATLTDFDMKWYPKVDQMKIRNVKSPFNFYEGTAQMQGTVTISKTGVAGAGKLETRGTELISRYMQFGSKDISAGHARFKVNSDDPEKPLLQGNNVSIKFNLEKNYADISPEIQGAAAITFPFAQVKTSIPEMHWDLAAQKITMKRDPNVPIEESYFYTTRKELDSLSFNAESAEYDLKTQQLKVSGIPYIIVADAMITPENNEVLIHENAKIGTLKNTTIILDTLNAYHRLTNGVVDIISRKEFTGHATYQYVNFLKDTFAIEMKDFRLEPISETEQSRRSLLRRKVSQAKMQTVATGAVPAQENLVLGAGMFYKGDMIMYATRPALQLDGYVKLDIKKIKDYNTWVKYEQTGDETDILIDFNTAITEEGQKVNAGLHVNGTDNNLYITFMSNKKSDDDEDFFLPEGKLLYDTATREFKIEDIEKARGNKLSGKVFAYKDETMQVRFEGPVNLFQGTKDFNVTASSLGQGNLETNEIRMNSFLMVDTSIPVLAFDIMGKQIQEVIKNEGADEGLGDQTELLYKIADLLGERVVKDFEQKSLQGYVSLGTLPQLAKPLVFSNVNLKWSEKNKAFYSEGKLGMSNILKNDINGAFEGFMEIKKSEDGAPVFHVFVKASPDAWYYFGLEDNRLLVQSSNSDFNSIISKKTNAGKSKMGEIAFVPGSDEETLTFINRFRKEYFDNDVPYSLSEGTSIIKKADGEEKKKEDDDGF